MTRVNRGEITARNKRSRRVGYIGLFAGLAIILVSRFGLEWIAHEAKTAQISKRVAFHVLTGALAAFPLLVLLMVWLYRKGTAWLAFRCPKCHQPWHGVLIDLLLATSRCPCCGIKIEVSGAPAPPDAHRGSYPLLDRRRFRPPIRNRWAMVALASGLSGFFLPVLFAVFGLRLSDAWVAFCFISLFAGFVVAAVMQNAENKRRGILTDRPACPACQTRLLVPYAMATGRCLSCGREVLAPTAEEDGSSGKVLRESRKAGRCCPSSRADLALTHAQAARRKNRGFACVFGLGWALFISTFALIPFVGHTWGNRLLGILLLLFLAAIFSLDWYERQWIVGGAKAFCPACGESLLTKFAQVSVTTGRCWRCGAPIFGENDP